MIDRAWILTHIPHQGTMCLLDGVESWDEHHVICRADSHRSAHNPLRANDSLGIANAIEYAAQAMAVHSALLIDRSGHNEGAAPKSGYLTSVRDVRWSRARLDDVAGELRVSVSRISGNENTVLYSFAISSGEQSFVQGRASVMLNAAA